MDIIFHNNCYINSGKSMVKEVQGFYCERCRRFMLLADDMNAHLRSITHYRNFLADVKALMSNAAAAEPKETEQTEVSGDAPRERDRKRKETASRLIKNYIFAAK